MSPRAACRLETLGFVEVYDYVPGKAGWLAHGLPTEGEQAARLRAKHVLRDDVVTTGLDDTIGQVREQVAGSPDGFALVIAADRTVLGRLRPAVLEGDASLRTEEAMEPGPSTVRADSPLEELTERLRARELHTAIVTTPEGRLLGVVRRADAERLLAAGPQPAEEVR